MKINILFAVIIIIGVALVISCEDDEEVILTQEKIHYKCSIQIKNERLEKYTYYDYYSDQLLYEVIFQYELGRIVETKIKSDQIEYVHIYFIEGDKVVESIDTVYLNDTDLRIYNNKYSHFNNHLIRRQSISQFITTDTIEVVEYVNSYSYDDEYNLISRTVESDLGRGPFTCWDEFEYSDQVLIIDVVDFTSVIIGSTSKKLRSKATYGIGCPGGPSYVFPTSEYEYEVDSLGYVTKLSHLYSRTSTTDPIVTIFEYDNR